MNDDRLDALLGSFYRDTALAPRDQEQGVGEVMDRVRQTRQRGRWWPLPAFDRPVSKSPPREPVPVPNPATNRPRPARGFTMFSALKFIAAGVILALFGGFLLAGVLTTQQDGEVPPAAVSASQTAEAEAEATTVPTESTESGEPAVRSDILPGVALTVAEVEPGVLRVVGDGQLDLDSLLDTWPVALTTGPDGSVWVTQGEQWEPDAGRFVTYRLRRLGDPTTDTELRDGIDLEVAPDGTVWQIAKGDPYTIHSFDGKRWRTWMNSRKRNPKAIEIAPDGTVWAMWQERRRAGDRYEREDAVLGYLDGGSWKKVSRWVPRGTTNREIPGPWSLTVTDDGEVRGHGGGGFDLARFADGAWEEIVVEDVSGHRLEGPEETVWVVDDEALSDDLPPADAMDRPFLRRVDRGVWQSWDAGDVPEAEGWAYTDTAHIAPDGALWLQPSRRAFNEDGSPTYATADGLVRFDGRSAFHVLRGHHVSTIDFGPGGYAWAIAVPDDGPRHLYVITPEAVAAKG